MKPFTTKDEAMRSITTVAVLAFFVGVFIALMLFGGILGPLGLLIGFALVVTTIVLTVRLFTRLWRRA